MKSSQRAAGFAGAVSTDGVVMRRREEGEGRVHSRTRGPKKKEALARGPLSFTAARLPGDDVLQRLTHAWILRSREPRDGRTTEVVVRLRLRDRDELIDGCVVTDLHELVDDGFL